MHKILYLRNLKMIFIMYKILFINKDSLGDALIQPCSSLTFGKRSNEKKYIWLLRSKNNQLKIS